MHLLVEGKNKLNSHKGDQSDWLQKEQHLKVTEIKMRATDP